MLRVHTFSSFQEARTPWESLEKEGFHYPFQSFWYQKLFAETFSKKYEVILLGVSDNQRLLAIGGFERDGDIVRFLGTRDVSGTSGLSQDISDFGDLLYSTTATTSITDIWNVIRGHFKQQLMLDYVREDSLTYKYFTHEKNVTITPQEVSPFIVLPDTWEEYLSSLSKKDRHELRRKIKRIETQTTYKMCSNMTMPHDFAEFIRLHRLSDEQKEKFMTDRMKDFFWNIITTEKDNWEAHICSMYIDEKEVASVMVFTNKSAMLLYNSGFDPQFSYYSVGLLIKAFLLKQAIADGKQIYDFLRGSERYKYDLGAKDMQLYRITTPFGK